MNSFPATSNVYVELPHTKPGKDVNQMVQLILKQNLILNVRNLADAQIITGANLIKILN